MWIILAAPCPFLICKFSDKKPGSHHSPSICSIVQAQQTCIMVSELWNRCTMGTDFIPWRAVLCEPVHRENWVYPLKRCPVCTGAPWEPTLSPDALSCVHRCIVGTLSPDALSCVHRCTMGTDFVPWRAVLRAVPSALVLGTPLLSTETEISTSPPQLSLVWSSCTFVIQLGSLVTVYFF